MRRGSYSSERRPNDENYRRDDCQLERQRRDCYNDNKSVRYGRNSRENSSNRNVQSNINYQRNESEERNHARSIMHHRNRDYSDGSFRKSSIDSRGCANNRRSRSPSQRSSDARIYSRSKRHQNENNLVHNHRQPDAKRQKLERSLIRLTVSYVISTYDNK